jgi:O-antigen ligase
MVCSLMLFGKGLPNLRTIRTGAILAASLVAFLFCSAGWSIDPQSSIRNAILYGFAVLGAVGIVANLRADEFMQQLALLCFLGAVASLLVFAVSPASAYGEAGDFRGIFSQKNVLGEAMTMGALASLHGLRATKTSRARNAIFLLVVSIVAVKSQSATSCLTIFSFCATDALLWLFRKGGAARIVAIAAIIVALPVMMFVAISPDSVLEIIGKDPTLTGRTEIWHFVVDIYQKPWLGWGYLAFWSPNNPAAMEIANALRWFAPQAHNGVLEMLLCVGLIGTAYFVFLWGRTVFLSLQCLSTNQNAIAISCLLSCGGIILVGISETVLIDPFEASTSVFFITGLFCEKAVRAARLRRSSTARVDVARRVPLRT